MSRKKFALKVMPSMATKTKNTASDTKKSMKLATLCENRKYSFGTGTLL